MQMFADRLKFQSSSTLNKLRFLRGHLRWVIVWPAAAVLLSAIGWTTLQANLEQDRLSLERSTLRDAAVVAQNYALHLARIHETVDQLILHVRYEWELSQGQLRLETFRDKRLISPSMQLHVGIVDREGNLITSTVVDPRRTYFGDREGFLMQKTAVIDILYMGGPIVDRLSGRTIIQFSRGLYRPDGSFDGVVMVAVPPQYLTTTYNESMLGPNGILAVVGDDYRLRVSRIGGRVYPPQTPAFTVTPYFPMLHGSQLLDGQTWFIDGRSRYIGWQQIEGLPLVAVAGLDQAEAMAPFHEMRDTSWRNAVMGTLALAAFALIAMFLSILLAWRKHQLELTQATYRMATEEGNEGFFIVRPQHGKNGAIVDFEVADCNSFGARLVHQRRETMVGSRFSMLFPGSCMEELAERMRQAVAAGYYEGEMPVPEEWPGPTKWLHLKMVRADGELALTMRDISDTKAHVFELERRGNEDALTALPNRHWLQTYLPQAIEHARAEQSMLALLFVDLDGFKSINDTMGHQIGDELLRYAAERLKVAVRPHDHVVRLGGDEFVVIVEQLEDREAAAHVAERIVSAFREKFRLSQGTHAIGTSIGIGMFPADGMDATALLQNADIAMYSAKTSGKGRYSFYEKKFYEALRARLDMERELQHAIEYDEFVMHYQPRIDIASGEMSSMEALVRWKHPMRGLLEPLEFIGLAEESGLILGIGGLVLEKVCAQLAAWSRQKGALVPVSVNVSPRQFNHGNFSRVVSGCLQRHGIDPKWLEIEVTESCMMHESQDISVALTSLQKMGIKFLIDDFGTGYSSLSQLQRLDFDVLKVDRAFTSKVDKTEEGKVFFTAIITMAHALGMRVVAEGVENASQLQVLKQLGCDEMQGFYISKPVPPARCQPALERVPVIESA